MSTRRRLVMSEDEMSQMSQGAALPSLGFHGDLNVRQHVSLLKIFQRSKCTSSRTLPYFANTIWFLHSRIFHQGTGKVIIFPKLSRCQLQIFGEVSAIVKPNLQLLPRKRCIRCIRIKNKVGYFSTCQSDARHS